MPRDDQSIHDMHPENPPFGRLVQSGARERMARPPAPQLLAWYSHLASSLESLMPMVEAWLLGRPAYRRSTPIEVDENGFLPQVIILPKTGGAPLESGTKPAPQPHAGTCPELRPMPGLADPVPHVPLRRGPARHRPPRHRHRRQRRRPRRQRGRRPVRRRGGCVCAPVRRRADLHRRPGRPTPGRRQPTLQRGTPLPCGRGDHRLDRPRRRLAVARRHRRRTGHRRDRQSPGVRPILVQNRRPGRVQRPAHGARPGDRAADRGVTRRTRRSLFNSRRRQHVSLSATDRADDDPPPPAPPLQQTDTRSTWRMGRASRRRPHAESARTERPSRPPGLVRRTADEP